MEIIRGTTPTIIISVQTDLDLSTVSAAWVYISQQNKVRVNKELSDISIDTEEKTITVTLTQQDTLNLKANVEAFFQIRLRLGETALATTATKIIIKEIYKDGVIQ